MRKTDRDIAHEKEARELNAILPTRLWVTAGGSKGPFTLNAHRLGRQQVRAVAVAVCEALGLQVPVELLDEEPRRKSLL